MLTLREVKGAATDASAIEREIPRKQELIGYVIRWFVIDSCARITNTPYF